MSSVNVKHSLAILSIFVLLLTATPARAQIVNGAPAIDLLGQYDQTSLIDPVPSYTKSSTADGPNLLGFRGPRRVAVDALHHRVFVANASNNRVLVYNLTVGNVLIDHIPDFVLGQTGFSTNSAATTQSGLSNPTALVYNSVDNRLFVGEVDNNRVVVFDVASITNGQNAAYVLGQPNFTTSSSATTQTKFKSPNGLAYESWCERRN